MNWPRSGDAPRRTKGDALTTNPPLSRSVTFAAHDEGAGLRGLYLTPGAPDVIADALEDHGVTEVWGGGRMRLPTALVGALHAPLEFTTAPCAHPVLADPHGATPGDADVAASLHESGHAVVYARDPLILAAVLRRWLVDHLDHAGVLFGLDGVGDAALLALLEPVPASSWSQPVLKRGARVCTLEFHTHASVDPPAPPSDPIRWVGAPGHGWRTDWAW